MKPVETNSEVERFLKRVCEQIKEKHVHPEVRDELAGHIAETAENLMSDGLSEDQAIAQAVRQMGDPIEIGSNLHRVHKPKIEWGVIAISVLFIGLGLLAMYAVQTTVPEWLRGIRFFKDKITFSLLGAAAALALWFFDYRKLRSWSNVMMFLTIAAMILTLMFGLDVNGSRHWLAVGPFRVDVMTASLFLLLAAQAGMKPAKAWSAGETVRELFVRLVIPAYLYLIGGSYPLCAMYLAGFGVLLWMTRRHTLQFVLVVLPGLAFLALGLLSSPYRMQRMIAFLNPQADPHGAGYWAIQSLEAIRSAGWWGHGMFSANNRIPELHSDAVFVNMIYKFGWSMGLIIAVAALLFVLQLAAVVRSVKDEYGKLLVAVFLAIFAMQFGWSMAMAVGLVPYAGVQLPFLSHGGSLLLMHLAAIGFILSINRRGRSAGHGAADAFIR